MTTPSPTASARAMADTVQNAASTPEREQPYAALGLKPDEYARIRDILGRRPTSGELAMYSVMWSEHCSYKSSKIYLRQFGEKVSDEMKTRLMVGMGQNAGVVDIGEGWAVTFKVESHNHPSYIEPFQGAATGVGGIVRDIISMGARPVAVMDQLRFGAIDNPDTARVVHGVVSGISFYGNCLGLPNIGGETVFDAVYQGNPLVNALAVGILRHEDLKLANASGAGNKVVLFGARTGGDGIGGASILASDSFDSTGPTKRPAVQVGDPFAEKVLIECCLELYRDDLVEAIQDLGAAGISCATSELAANGGSGMRVDLEKVLLRDPSLTPEEILMSESQERMMAIVAPEKLDAFLAVVEQVGCRDQRARRGYRRRAPGDPVARRGHRGRRPRRPSPSTDRCTSVPSPTRPGSTPCAMIRRAPSAARTTPTPSAASSCSSSRARTSPTPSWVTNQYDYYVMGNTALSFPDDAGMIRVDEHSGLGFAIATDCNGRFCQLDPYEGAKLALAEAYRNVAVTRRGAHRRHGLPQLRQPREPRGHVAVLAGGRGSRRRMPGARHPGHRRQRLLLQPDRRPADLPDPGRRRPRASSTTSRAASRADGRTRARTSTSSASPRPSSADRPGPARSTATSAAARRRSTSATRSDSPSSCTRHPSSRWSPAPTTCRPVAWPRRSPRACCASASARACGSARSWSATGWMPHPLSSRNPPDASSSPCRARTT